MRKQCEDDVLLHIPDDGIRYEWVAGRIMKVSEPMRVHGWISMKLGGRLNAFVEAHDLGDCFINDTLFLLQREPRIVRGPDVAFVAKGRGTVSIHDDGVWAIAPDLVAEVHSPSQSYRMMRQKIADYLRLGVRLVWHVDPKRRTVVRHRPGESPVTLGPTDTLGGEDVVPGFRCAIAPLFPSA